MAKLLTNIDDVRARIMQLESATVFDQRAWAEALIALSDRPCARADAARRMETAKMNQKVVVQSDVQLIGCNLFHPAVEMEPT